RQSLRDARFMPAPGDSTFLWAIRREDARMQLSRLEIRGLQRAMSRNSFADQPGQTESGAHFRGALSLGRAGRIFLGVHERSGIAVAGGDSCRAEARNIQRKIPD